VRTVAASLVLSLHLALTGCAGCFIDAIPVPAERGVALDCDPLIEG
jgi:hypothetical protein